MRLVWFRTWQIEGIKEKSLLQWCLWLIIVKKKEPNIIIWSQLFEDEENTEMNLQDTIKFHYTEVNLSFLFSISISAFVEQECSSINKNDNLSNLDFILPVSVQRRVNNFQTWWTLNNNLLIPLTYLH